MDSLLGIAGLSLIEGYLLQRSAFNENTFRTVCFGTFGVNLLLKAFWNLVVYPFFFNLFVISLGLFGNAKLIFDNPRGRTPLIWMKTIPNEGLIFFRGLLGQSHLLATNHQALLDIMSTRTYDFEKPWKAREFLARIIGFGLILSEGAAHKKQRKALNPAFNIKNIRALYTLMWEKTGILLDELEKEMKENPMEGTNPESGTGKIEMSEWASRLTLDIIGPAAMGRDFRTMQQNENKVADSFMAILEPTKKKMAFLAVNFLLPQWFSRKLPWGLNKVIDDETGFLRGMCEEIVQEKKVWIAETKPTTEDLTADILGTMMVGGDFSDSELVDQMLTFLAAGHETTASALTWTCYLLCQNPSAQEKLRAEIRERVPNGNHPITWNDLESLPYLNGVCQEVLRLYPTVPSTLRESFRDTIVAGKLVPKGTRIILCPYAVNRSPEFWGDNGEEFIPALRRAFA